RQGSATEALQALIVRNPNRRPVLLNIIGLCEGGCPSSVISERVDEWQRDNWSVYAPMTLCRMLERAGALTLEMPDVSEEHESAEEGVAYLEIRETVDPVWRATRALALRAGTSPARLPARLCWDRRGALRRWRHAAVMEARERRESWTPLRLTDAMESQVAAPLRSALSMCWKPATASSGAMAPGTDRFGAGYARRAEEREGLNAMVVMEEAVVEEAAASEDVNLVELMNARAILRHAGASFREEVDLPTLRELQKMRFPRHGQCGRR
ncbi:MAG: hypothetical protein ACLSVD_13250, partial [Eggerthellaceae bacterium]